MEGEGLMVLDLMKEVFLFELNGVIEISVEWNYLCIL